MTFLVTGYGYISASFLFLAVPPVLSKPFDYVKIQLQMMQPDAKGRYPYTGALDCAKKTFKLGGPLKFYSGFVAYCFTLAPRNMVQPASFLFSLHSPCVSITIS